MKYMMLIKHTDDYRGIKPPQALMDAMGEFVGEYIKKGKFLEGAGLKASHRGKRIRLHNGDLTVIDGPFAETKELVGGFAIMDLENDEEALVVGTRFMEMHQLHWPEFEGESEIRPFEEGEPGSE
ncbi:MAG TPA: YciI family protein [Gemmatimonadaceae bacterium]|jgi:hypothetical protein